MDFSDADRVDLSAMFGVFDGGEPSIVNESLSARACCADCPCELFGHYFFGDFELGNFQPNPIIRLHIGEPADRGWRIFDNAQEGKGAD